MNLKVILPFTAAAMLLALVFASLASAMPALALSHGGHDAPVASSGSDPNLASQGTEQYTYPYPTTTTILSDLPDPSQSGQTFTVRFRVYSPFGGIPPGYVVVAASPGGASCRGTLVSGQGSCYLRLSNLGVYTLTAHYSGDYPHFLPSSDTELHCVGYPPTTTTILSDLPDPSPPGQPFTMTLSVASFWGTPTGTITVTTSENGPSCTEILESGEGSCSLALDNSGVYTLTASYSGDATHLPSSDTEPHSAGYPTVTTILSDLSDPSVPGQPFTVTFSVTSTWGMPSDTAVVTVSAGGESCTSTLAAGNGSCTLTLFDIGDYTLTAAYSGDDDFLPSWATTMHTVIQAETTITILNDLPDPSLPRQPFTVTFSVTSTWSTPAGWVFVAASPGDAFCMGTSAEGYGSCFLVINSAKDYTLTANYWGNTEYLPSHDTAPHTVTQAETTTTILSDLPDPSLPGQSFKMTFSVTSAWGTSTGAVTITVSEGDASCTGELVGGSGSCTLTIAHPGEYTLEAVYSGDDNHLSSHTAGAHSVSAIHIYLPVTVK